MKISGLTKIDLINLDNYVGDKMIRVKHYFKQRGIAYPTGLMEAIGYFRAFINRYVEICDQCEGDGYIIVSCCGDNLKPNIGETDICPSCGEHCGDDQEDCEDCDGNGWI